MGEWCDLWDLEIIFINYNNLKKEENRMNVFMVDCFLWLLWFYFEDLVIMLMMLYKVGFYILGKFFKYGLNSFYCILNNND